MKDSFRPLSGMRCLNLRNSKNTADYTAVPSFRPLSGMRCLNLDFKLVKNTITSFRPLSGMRCLNLLLSTLILILLRLQFPSPLGDEVLKPTVLRYRAAGYDSCSFRPLSGMRCLNQAATNLIALIFGKGFPSPLGDEVLKPLRPLMI